jgi:hypothetical protein
MQESYKEDLTLLIDKFMRQVQQRGDMSLLELHDHQHKSEVVDAFFHSTMTKLILSLPTEGLKNKVAI